MFRTISNKLPKRGHSRVPKQCCEKIKTLKKKNEEAADSLHKTAVGIESDDDLEDHKIFVGCKWFEAQHPVMCTQAVVSPLHCWTHLPLKGLHYPAQTYKSS